MGTVHSFPAAVKQPVRAEQSAEERLGAIIEKHIRAGHVIHNNRPEVLAHIDCAIIGLDALMDASGRRARIARRRLLADIRANVNALREREAFATGGAA